MLAFTLLALTLGVLGAVVIEPLQGFDEPTHFLNVERISRGELRYDEVRATDGRVAHGWWYDRRLSDVVSAWRAIAGLERVSVAHPRRGSVFHEVPRASYPASAYAPSVVAVALARATGGSPHRQLLAARLAGLLAYIALAAGAVALVPSHAWTFAAIGLLPVAIVQAATVSADTLANGLALLAVALAWRFATAAVVPGRERGLASGVIVGLAITKPPYVLLAAVFLIAWRAPLRRRVLWSLVVAAVLFVALSALAQLDYRDQRASVPNSLNLASLPVDSGAQLRWIAAHPRDAAAVVATTFRKSAWSAARGTIAAPPAGLRHYPDALRALCLAGVLAIALVEPRPARVSRRQRAIAAGVAIATAAAIGLLLYLGSNPVGYEQIYGYQGRYLFPLLPLLVLAAAPARPMLHLDRSRLVLLRGSALVLVAAATAWCVVASRHL